MTKIVYNACYGGFGISKRALLRGRELTNNPKWGGVMKGETYPDGTINTFEFSSYGKDLSRTDPILIQLVEELGKHAGGTYADLCITELPTGTKYRIDEYDGSEAVMSQEDYEWLTA